METKRCRAVNPYYIIPKLPICKNNFYFPQWLVRRDFFAPPITAPFNPPLQSLAGDH